MDSGMVFRAVTIVGALTLLSACAGEVHRHSAQSICEAAGGSWAQGTCQPGTPKSGREICDRMGARWIQELGVCEFEGGKA